MSSQCVATLLLSVICTAKGGLFDEVVSVVELSPSNDTYILVGKELVLNCSLTSSYSGVLNSSYLSFGYVVEHPEAVERILTSGTRQLTIPAMQKSDTGTYFCYLNETGEKKSLNTTAFTSVHVGDLPTPVTNISCISDNFQTMTCTWCPSVMPSTLTSWKLLWAVGTDKSGVCFGMKTNPCSCRFCDAKCAGGITHSFLRYLLYKMNFTTINGYGTVQSQVVVIASEHIVKPRVVQKLAVKSHNATSIVLSWSHPDKLEPDWFQMKYEVQYDKDGKNMVRELHNELTVTLTDLHPATEYKFNVRCQPSRGIYWSNSVLIVRTTDEAEPSSSPPLLLGSFRVQPYAATSQGTPGGRNVIVFWQPIPQQNRNGKIRGYEVSCHSFRHALVHMPPVNMTKISARVPRLDTRQSYTISVQAFNGAGRSPMAVLNIPEASDLRPPLKNVMAERSENQSTITFSWDPPSSPVSNYTLFWCQGRADVTDACLAGPLFHRIIPGNSTKFDLRVVADRKLQRRYVYSLSVNSESGSSGMTRDWICVFDYYGLPGKPQFVINPIMNARNVSLSWEPLLCSTKIRGRVLNYNVELWVHNTGGRRRRMESITLPANATSCKFTNLMPYTTYTVKMAARAHVGSGETFEKQIRTLESAPDMPPASLKGYLMNKTHVSLSWHMSPAPNGNITKYEVYAVVNEMEVWRVSVKPTRRSVIHGVNGNITYRFFVVAVNKMGQSVPSIPLVVQTPIRMPGQIRKDQLHMDIFNSTIARVQWTRPSFPHGPIDKYILEFARFAEGATQADRIWTETHPGNETKANLSIVCHGSKAIIRMRIAAMNQAAANPVGRWSEPKNVTLCDSNVGERTLYAVIAIASSIAFFILICFIGFIIHKYYKKARKKIPIEPPSRTKVTIPDSSQCDENDNNDNLHVANETLYDSDRSSLIISRISMESVHSDGSLEDTSESIEPYVRAVNNETDDDTSGSSVQNCNMEAEEYEADSGQGDACSGPETERSSDERHAEQPTLNIDHMSATLRNMQCVVNADDVMLTPNDIATGNSHITVADSSAMSSGMTDSSANSNSYCLGNKNFEYIPTTPAAEIDPNRPVMCIPDVIKHDVSESVV